MINKVVLLVFVVSFSNGQVIDFGNCPDAQIVRDFEPSRYVGKWYEIERYPLIWEFLGKCVTAEYTANGDGTIGVYNEQTNSVLGNKQSINGTAIFDGPESEAKLTVEFPGVLGQTMRGAYWVLGTDYDNFAVVWSCRNIGQIQFLSAWILGRDSHPSPEILTNAYDVIARNNINRAHFSRTDQDNCPQ